MQPSFNNSPKESQTKTESPIISEVLLHDVLDVLEDLSNCNNALLHAQIPHMPDLQITQRAEMLPILLVEDMTGETVNNFGLFFKFHKTRNDEGTPIPVTAEDIDGFIDGTFDTGIFFAHNTRPAFWRMLVLFPEFTEQLILKASNPENSKSVDEFYKKMGPNLLIAYKIMSKLISADDPGVIQDGEVDKEYLFR